MITNIKIDCDSLNELFAHFSAIEHAIKKRQRDDLESPQQAFAETVQIYDDNCYGTHEVTITP